MMITNITCILAATGVVAATGGADVDWTQIAVFIFGIILALCGFVINDMRSQIKSTEEKLTNFQLNISREYVKKDDYRLDVDRLFQSMKEFSEKLERGLHDIYEELKTKQDKDS